MPDSTLREVPGHPNRLCFAEPGYDCRTRCEHTPQGEHGISGGRWVFVVKDRSIAVALSVLTSFYPESADGHLKHKWPGWPADSEQLLGHVSWHRPTPTHRDSEGRDCEYVPGGRCYGNEVRYSLVDEFHGLLGPTLEDQPEAMWVKLECMAAVYRRGVES